MDAAAVSGADGTGRCRVDFQAGPVAKSVGTGFVPGEIDVAVLVYAWPLPRETPRREVMGW